MNKESLEQAFGVPFRSAKDNWKGPCPFHNEVTPSFFVHKEEYVAHCFGCGVSGPIDKLLAGLCNIEVGEARLRLNIEAGHTIANKIRRNSHHAAAERTVFPESWLAPYKKEVHKYVISRGLKPDVLRAAGSRYDPATKRQVFPHRDQQGRLLGAAGRSCREPTDYPKWLFYWEYSKGQALYRIPEVRSIRDVPNTEGLIIVEGIFDVLWLYQHGYTNVAAILGSKPSKWQIRELREHGGPYILGLDNDLAGQEGTERLYKVLKRTGPVYFTPWPNDVNDWMDLDAEGIRTAVEGRQSAVGRRLREGVKERNRVTVTQKEDVRAVGSD